MFSSVHLYYVIIIDSVSLWRPLDFNTWLFLLLISVRGLRLYANTNTAFFRIHVFILAVSGGQYGAGKSFSILYDSSGITLNIPLLAVMLSTYLEL